MTEQPDDQPTPQQRAAFALAVNEDLATARRLLAALAAGDRQGIAGVTVAIVRSGRGTEVLHALALQALEFAEQLVPDRQQLQDALDRLALDQLDVAAEMRQQAPGTDT